MAEIPSALRPAGQQHREGHRAARRFQALVLALGLAFVPLAVMANAVPYFAFDPPLTLAVQPIQAPWFATLLTAVSWIGFPPQSNVIFGALILGLFLARRWLEALALLGSLWLALTIQLYRWFKQRSAHSSGNAGSARH